MSNEGRPKTHLCTRCPTCSWQAIQLLRPNFSHPIHYPNGALLPSLPTTLIAQTGGGGDDSTASKQVTELPAMSRHLLRQCCRCCCRTSERVANGRRCRGIIIRAATAAALARASTQAGKAEALPSTLLPPPPREQTSEQASDLASNAKALSSAPPPPLPSCKQASELAMPRHCRLRHCRRHRASRQASE
jgi:hypothetical protein